MERLYACTNGYIKSISRRDAGEGKEKQLPIGHFGSVLVSHGDDFEPDSEFGQCLSTLGRANERLARMQETYVANATSSWVESLERSLVQMKEYQKAKQKLESRRLAFDTAQGKMQKSKKEDFKMEEELRSQKMKYEESSEDVYRRMLDIKEAEADSIQDLGSFLEAELTYYDRCREVLLQVKRDWPAYVLFLGLDLLFFQLTIYLSTTQPSRSNTASPVNGIARLGPRSRSNTASSFTDRFSRIAEDEPFDPPSKISSRLPSGQNSPRRELPGFDLPSRPVASRTQSGFEGPTSLGVRDGSPAGMPRLSRVPTADSSTIASVRSNLRITKSRESNNIFDDADSEVSDLSTSLPSQYDPPQPHRSTSWSMNAQPDVGAKKMAPPPPPSRAKKPPPPPPPMKRSALSSSEVPQY